MSKKSVSCIATSQGQADQIVDHLKAESFSDTEISVGAAVGASAGGLTSRGVPQVKAEFYEGKIKACNILISVRTDDVGDIARAKDMFKQAGAQNICTADEVSAPKDDGATERGPRPFEFSA
jgi:hypothetical protein